MKRYSIAIICIFFLLSFISCSDNVKFNSVQWKNWVESENNSNLRWRMSKDLINNFSLKGMSKDEIIELLGEPENMSSSNEFLYFLGHTGKGINTGTLKISFLNDIVYEIKIYQGQIKFSQEEPFMGNTVTTVSANQEVNPNVLGSADAHTNTQGKMMMHGLKKLSAYK